MNRSKYPWGSFLKQIAVIAVPVALQNLLTTTGSMVDTMMIASLGQTEVGAVYVSLFEHPNQLMEQIWKEKQVLVVVNSYRHFVCCWQLG